MKKVKPGPPKPLSSIEDFKFNHRTLVVFHTGQKHTEDFSERAQRLLDSLNNPNTMKANCISVAGNTVYPGLVLLDGVPDVETVDTSDNSENSKWTKFRKQFTQVLDVYDTKAK